MKPIDSKSQIATLVRDVEALMQTPDTVEIGQLAKLIERLNGEFSLLRGQASAITASDHAEADAFDFNLLDDEGSDVSLDADQIERLADAL